MDTNTNSNSQNDDIPINDFQKVMQMNKLGALFLSNDKYDKAISILSKTLEFYKEKKQSKQIPNFFYNNLYCNLAKSYSCIKQFKPAETLYTENILNHPVYKLLLNNSDFLKEKFLININDILDITNNRTEKAIVNHMEEVKKKVDIILNFFSKDSSIRKEFTEKINSQYKPNNLHTLASFTDSLVNLSVIFQYHTKETINSFDMYYLAVLCENNNEVANIDFNNILREINLKYKSDEYIIRRIEEGYKSDNNGGDLPCEIKTINNKEEWNQNIENNSKNNLAFICMKWGTKYDSQYVNKLYNGISNNYHSKFNFYCITENPEGLNNSIKQIPLNSTFKGWMKKSLLFSPETTNQIETDKLICFIDLDMVICGNLNYLDDFKGNFCLMKTDDIECERSIGGYNSSIVLWKKGYGKEIYDYMLNYEKYIVKQVVRFDHYLEFVVNNSNFVQDEFVGQVLDYNTYCKGKDELPSGSSIIAFPREPKPHQCKEKWVGIFWV